MDKKYMNKTITIVSIPFTGLGKPEYRGDDWFKYRIELFHQYTLKSLLNQTDKDFIIWLQFREEERDNPLIETMYIPHKHIFTFNGIVLWDDKKENEHKGLLDRLEKTLPELEEIIGDRDVKMLNVASDDMYSSEVIDSINKEKFKNGRVLTHKHGYVYSHTEDRLAEWLPRTNPPFYCLMMDNKTFLNPKEHFKRLSKMKSHEDVIVAFKEKEMPDGRYCVLTHNGNISTFFDHPFSREEVYYEDTKKIIKNKFGI